MFAVLLLSLPPGYSEVPQFVTEMATFRKQPTNRKAGARTTVILTRPLHEPPRRQFPRRGVLLTLLGISSVGVGAFFLPKVFLVSSTSSPSTPTSGSTPPSDRQTPSSTPTGQTSTPSQTPKTAPGTLYASLEHDVRSVAFSPDGKYIATGSGNLLAQDSDTVQIWNAANGNALFTCRGHTDYVGSVGWSPDGKFIASGSADKTVRVWDATNGRTLLTCKGHTASVNVVAWSPDGKSIASGSTDKTVRVWDATNGSTLSSFTNANLVKSIAWSPDSTRIVLTNVHECVVIKGTPQLTYSSSSSCNAVAWSPNGSRIASGEKDAAHIWDAASGSTLLAYTGHSGAVNGVTWSPDGKSIASCSSDQTVRVWSPKDGSTLYVFEGHNIEVFSVAWSPDGSRIASVGGGKVLVWQAP